MFLAPFSRGLARHLHLACLALTAATAAVFAQTNTPTANDGFDPNVNGNVYDIVADNTGKLLVIGQFTSVQPNGGLATARTNIARFNADGSLDGTFDPGADGPVRAIAVQKTDGKIIVGGDFTHIGGVARNRIARLNTDGSVDTTFTAGIGASIDPNVPATTPQVFAVLIQPDNHIVVGGSFNSATPTGSTTAVTRNNIARFDSKGALDAFNPNANAMVSAIALHVSNKLVIGGSFTEIESPERTSRLHVARLNPDGTVDSDFDPKANNGVATIAVQQDGKILLGGYFSTLQPPTDANPATRSHLARLNVDGTLDSEFFPTVGGNVLRVITTRDGGILVGGHFSLIYARGNLSYSRGNVAKLTSDGSVDATFNPNVNGDVDALLEQSDGKLVLGGYFTRAQPTGVTTAIVRNHIARVLTNGSLDTAFQIDQGGRILASVTQNDGKIVVAGTFTSMGGVSRSFIARLNADGSLDTSYNPDLNGPVYTLAYDSKADKVLIGGAFTSVGPSTDLSLRNYLARLNPNGTVDSDFNPNLNGAVATIVIQGDGNILVGGTFTTVHPFGTSDDVTRPYLLRLTNAGQVDTSFYPNPDNRVNAIGIQSDGKIVVGGGFTRFQPNATGDVISRPYLARLNADGTVDSTYNPGPGPTSVVISSIAIQSDDKAVVGGSFLGFVPPGATAVVTRHGLARVNKDGSIDTTFDPEPNGVVLALALQGDKILVGGTFTIFNADKTDWKQAKYIGRLNADGTVDTSFNLDIEEVPGNRVDSITIQKSTGAILIGGAFATLQPPGSTSRVSRNNFARLTSAGQLDATFNPIAGGYANAVINAIAVQTNGKIIVGGKFTDLGGATITNIAQFNPEGTPDRSFNTALGTNEEGSVNAIAVRANGSVSPTQLGGFAWLNNNGSLNTSFVPAIQTEGRINTSLVQDDGKIILAGAFSDTTNQTPGNIVRLNANGSIDTTFTASVTGAIYGLLKQSDGKIIIYGNFTTVDTATRNYIARLNADGSLDTSFDPSPNGLVSAVLLQSDGSLIVGGAFTSFTPNGATSATARNYLAKVASNGTVDANYNPNPNGNVNALALQADGKLLAGGSFTSVQPNTSTTSTTRNYIARFNPDGTLDTGFDPNPNGMVNAIVVLPSQQILIGGAFQSLQPTLNGNVASSTTHYGIAVLGSDGNPDPSFTAGTSNVVTSVVRASDGSLLVAGQFTTVLQTGNSTPIARFHFARFTAGGFLDESFNPDLTGDVTSVVFGPNNTLLVGGSFTAMNPAGVILVGGDFASIGGVSRKNLAELNGDGSVNANFAPNPDKPVAALLPLADGRFVIGGSFTSLSAGGAAATRNGIARFKADGSLDSDFNPAITGGVTAIAVQSSGNLIVGTAGLSGLVRVTTSGAVDNTFNAGASFVGATAIAVQPDDKIVVAGGGSGVGARVMRLNADGSIDSSFTPVTLSGNDVRTLTLQADGSIIVGGTFTSIGGKNISYLARLTASGAVDTGYNASIAFNNNGTTGAAQTGSVTALALQSDGRLIVGGRFTTVGGLQRVALARLSNTKPAPQAIGVSDDGKTITWVRHDTLGNVSSAGEIVAVTFEKSLDGENWTPADDATGIGKRIGTTADWQLTNANVPTTGPVYIRARGIVPTSAGTSTGAYEIVQLVNIANPVKTAGTVVATVQSTTPWDATHYVWTLDASGVMRIADAFTQATLDASKTVLIDGSHPTSASSSRLADLSTRGIVKPDAPLIGGFTVTGSSTRPVLIRAVGPGLTPFGVTNFLKTPQLVLYNNTGTVIATGRGWSSSLSTYFDATGAFPLTPGSTDAAMVTTLNPGTYTVQVVDADGANSPGGDALVEVYDAGNLADGGSRLINLSARGTITTNGTLIGGLYVSGNASRTMLIRGIGPALAKYGVGGVLTDPQIAVYNGDGDVVVTNDNWQVSSQPSALDYGAAISSAATSVSAFPFDSGSKDAALIVTLPAGAYTIQVKGAGGASGAAMIEVYELP